MKRLSPLKKRAGEGMGGLGGREKLLALERFNFEKGETRRRRHSAARPKVSGKTALFPRNDRPYGLKCEAFQTENALGAVSKKAWTS